MLIFTHSCNTLIADGIRSSKVLEEMLERYTGTIQSDGYAAYKGISKGKDPKRIRRIACLAHIRSYHNFNLIKSSQKSIADN